jgi:hypothetical protein
VIEKDVAIVILLIFSLLMYCLWCEGAKKDERPFEDEDDDLNKPQFA